MEYIYIGNMFYIYLIGFSMQTAEWMMFGVPIYYPLGFKQHPLEGAGICIYYIPYYKNSTKCW